MWLCQMMSMMLMPVRMRAVLIMLVKVKVCTLANNLYNNRCTNQHEHNTHQNLGNMTY